MTSRRTFIGSLGAMGAVASVGAKTAAVRIDPGREMMRFGALADIHVSTTEQLPYVEKAFRKLDEWKVDAVLACGDLADYGMRQQLQLLADTWFKVFPNGRGSDGRPVANLMHYGDHDMSTNYLERPDAVKMWPNAEERKAGLIFKGDRKKIWEDCFHEEWSPIAFKDVKGYKFILSHFTKGEPGNKYGNTVPGLKEFMASHTFDPAKPFFYSQHRIPRNTACGPYVWGQEDGETTSLFSAYPNLVAFCGHCHMSAIYEKSIWQGDFTCVQVPSLRYSVTQAGRENGYAINDRPPNVPAEPSKMMRQHPSGKTHQGLLCKVHEHALVITRWEFEHDLPMGPDWVVPFSSFGQPAEERPFAFAKRAKTFPVPAFAADAKVTLTPMRALDRLGRAHDAVNVSFPPAVDTAPRANDYEVTVTMKEREVERIVLQKRVYSPRYLYGTAMEDVDVSCPFALDELPKGWPLSFSVRPLNAFGAKGGAIGTDFEIFPPAAEQGKAGKA